jgi:excisionase family DNA binding protein
MNRLLTIAEAADTLHLSSSTVRSLCQARKLRHERHGLGRGAIRIPPEAIDEYRAKVTVAAGQNTLLPLTIRKPIKLKNLSLD